MPTEELVWCDIIILMLNLNSFLIFSENPKKLAEFYNKVFDKKPDWEDHGYTGWDFGGFNMVVGPHDKVKGKNSTPERFMFNLETTDVKGEFERIKETGAEVITEPYQMGEKVDEYEGWIATFADPDGNYFQLMTPMKP